MRAAFLAPGQSTILRAVHERAEALAASYAAQGTGYDRATDWPVHFNLDNFSVEGRDLLIGEEQVVVRALAALEAKGLVRPRQFRRQARGQLTEAGVEQAKREIGRPILWEKTYREPSSGDE